MFEKDTYEDIINLPHPISKKRKPMSQYQRAAQFSPFSALTGYDYAIYEAARITDQKIELDEDEKLNLNRKLMKILENKKQRIPVKVTYFVKDLYKSGGFYQIHEGVIKKIDEIYHRIFFEDKTKIDIDNIIDIQNVLFPDEDWL